MERTAYTILLILAVLWLGAMVFGSLAAFPFGIPVLALFVALGLLFAKVLRERIQNAEDDHYSKHVDQ